MKGSTLPAKPSAPREVEPRRCARPSKEGQGAVRPGLVGSQAAGLDHASGLVDTFLFSLGPVVRNSAQRGRTRSAGQELLLHIGGEAGGGELRSRV